jgi:hypothetical protein
MAWRCHQNGAGAIVETMRHGANAVAALKADQLLQTALGIRLRDSNDCRGDDQRAKPKNISSATQTIEKWVYARNELFDYMNRVSGAYIWFEQCLSGENP